MGMVYDALPDDMVVTRRAHMAEEIDFELEMALSAVKIEVCNAIKKHGLLKTPLNPKMPTETAFIILAEEVGEVAHALTYDASQSIDVEDELIQVAAMATAMIVGLRQKRITKARNVPTDENGSGW